MKTFVTILTAACLCFGTSFQLSSADTSRYEVWDGFEAAASQLFIDDRISEHENDMFQEVLGMGRAGKTEEAIKALNAFLKGNRNTALREVSRETLAALIDQRKAKADYAAKHANEKRSCSLEMKICPNGVTIVGRDGPNCEFTSCPAN